MKKLFVILSMVLFVSGIVAQTNSNNFIKTKEKTEFFKKIKADNDILVGIKSSGEKMEFKIDDVIAYMQNTKYYQKMPVYLNNVVTGQSALMKVVKSEKGLTLFEYKDLANGKKELRYFVFNEKGYVVEMNEKNESSLMSYFN